MTRTVCCLLALFMLSGCFGSGGARPTLTQQRLADLKQRAQINADKGRYADAERLLSEALTLTSSLDDQTGQAAVLVQKARLARHKGAVDQAEKAVHKALELSAGTALFADAAQEKALQELQMGRLDSATRWAETALREERGDSLARRLNLLARLALLQKNFDQAGILAEKALAGASAAPLATERANALRILGVVRGHQKRYQEGEKLLQEALSLDKELELPDRIAADLEALAQLAKEQGKSDVYHHLRQRAQTVRDSRTPQTVTERSP